VRRQHRVLFLILCVAGIAFLTLSTAGCLGGLFAGAYSVSGRVTDKDDPAAGVAGAKLSFGRFGTTTTDAQGNWSKDKLKGQVQISIAKEGWDFAPASKKVTGPSTTVNFVGRFCDYMGLSLGAKWEYELSIDITGVENPTVVEPTQASQEVVRVDKQDARTLFYIFSESEEPQLPDGIDAKSLLAIMTNPEYTAIVSRKGDNYYDLTHPDQEESEDHLIMEVPLSVGDTYLGLTVEREETVTTSAGSFTALYCAGESDEGTGHAEAEAWFAPSVGLVKATSVFTDSELPGMVMRMELELTSYTP
jgi:hypothetical protein